MHNIFYLRYLLIYSLLVEELGILKRINDSNVSKKEKKILNFEKSRPARKYCSERPFYGM